MSAPTPDETILGLLAAQPQHGYQLLEHFNQPDRLGRVWSMSTSQVYAVLKRLQSGGLVIGETVVVADAPPRTEYTLTPAGEQRLHAWLFDPHPSPSIRRVRIEFLSKLYIADLLGLAVEEIIQHQRDACLARQHELEKQNTGSDPKAVDALLSDFILGQLRSAISWIDTLEYQTAQGRVND